MPAEKQGGNRNEESVCRSNPRARTRRLCDANTRACTDRDTRTADSNACCANCNASSASRDYRAAHRHACFANRDTCSTDITNTRANDSVRAIVQRSYRDAHLVWTINVRSQNKFGVDCAARSDGSQYGVHAHAH